MNLASFIDHTILRPETTEEQVVKICKEAKEYGFASVCVNPYYTQLVKKQLDGSNVKTCTVIGFPLGANTLESKIFEANDAIKNGAEEIDMVINIGAFKDKKYTYIEEEIRGLVETCKGRACLKVIIETCLLNEEEKKNACLLAVKAGADFVKTSTGFSNGGATVDDVRLMKKTVGYNAKVKASGGIRNYEKASEMVENGADRIGASSSVYIVNGAV